MISQLPSSFLYRDIDITRHDQFAVVGQRQLRYSCHPVQRQNSDKAAKPDTVPTLFAPVCGFNGIAAGEFTPLPPAGTTVTKICTVITFFQHLVSQMAGLRNRYCPFAIFKILTNGGILHSTTSTNNNVWDSRDIPAKQMPKNKYCYAGPKPSSGFCHRQTGIIRSSSQGTGDSGFASLNPAVYIAGRPDTQDFKSVTQLLVLLLPFVNKCPGDKDAAVPWS